MSIAEEIARLQQAKADLKASIIAKGGTITNETIDEYASKVSALPSPKEEETKTITPNFSSGNVVVTPTSGKVMTQVTINKDSNLIASNIKKGVIIFGITGSYEPAPSGPKVFEVGDVLPATTQLKISWDSGLNSLLSFGTEYRINNLSGWLIMIGDKFEEGDEIVFQIQTDSPLIRIYYNGWMSPYTDYSGDHNYIILDTTTWSEDVRTIVSMDGLDCIYWEDLNT